MGGIASDSFGGELPVRGLHLWGVGCSWAPAAILCFWGVFMVGSRWAGWGGGGLVSICLCVLLGCCGRGLISGGREWAVGYVSTQIRDFPILSRFATREAICARSLLY